MMPNKKRERYYLDALIECNYIDAPIAVDDSESPDFILNIGTALVGVEVTEYFHPPTAGNRPHQEVQSLKDRVMQLADEIHARAGGPALYVTAIFSPHNRPTKNTLRPIAESLAEAVLQQVPPATSGSKAVYVPRDLLPPEIVKVMLFRSVYDKDKLW